MLYVVCHHPARKELVCLQEYKGRTTQSQCRHLF